MAAPGPPSTPVADDERDEDLMLRYAAGRAEAFDALYARHKGPVYRYVLRHCGNRAAADEMCQDVWMNVVRARVSYVPTAKFTTWLYTLARHRLVDHWRANAQVGFVSIDDEGADAADRVESIPGSRVDEPETRAASNETGRRLLLALAALPVAQREAFLLQQEGGMSLAEIAIVTGAPEETVKSRLRYATARLRAALEEVR